MSQFKVGSIVKQLPSSQFYYQSYGSLGKVLEAGFCRDGWWVIEWGDVSKENYPEECLELISNKNAKTLMKTLNTMMKKLLDSDTQTLVEAGYINGDLELTDTGQSELLAIQFGQNKAALVASAQTKIDEEAKK